MLNKSSLFVVIIFTLIGSAETIVAAEQLNNVVVISIDALHPEALALSKIPNITKLMRAGVYTLDGSSTDPPKTLIAHTAMFTGLSPGESGKVDNDWTPGEITVEHKTIFDNAKAKKFKTGYFFSKERLGYLVNKAIDVHELSQDGAIFSAESFIKTPGRHFVFLHISGLDQVGPEFGWLSPEYLEELAFIDDYLSLLIDTVISKQNYLLIVTSDHAGHGKIHGSDHQEDYRLPLIVCSDIMDVKRFQGISFSVTKLKQLLENLLEVAS
jgi:predicted AlkP superfamily pyrophosphatase or phosphodiesterase